MDIIDTKRFINQHIELFGNEIYSNIHKKEGHRLTKLEPTSGPILSFKSSIENCKKCNLGNTRNKFVFGSGDPSADLLLVGEAPGQEEDLQGEPFVGRAGKLLDKILKAIGYTRNTNVFITNIVKCRPPDNRDPLASEVAKCEPYLLRQIKLIKPKLIVSLGRVSGKTLLKTDIPLKEMRSTLHDYHGIPLKVTYHPAALLRNPNLKKDAWEDFQWVRDYLTR